MAQFHAQHNALATLAVAERATSRPLLFDAQGQLLGRGAANEAGDTSLETLAFGGIHVVSPRIFAKLEEEGAFPIIDAYVRLAARGETILGFRADGAYWRDLGRPDDLIAAERDIESGEYPTA
jgi:NDP-sugar pyrophosphorylase family protein